MSTSDIQYRTQTVTWTRIICNNISRTRASKQITLTLESHFLDPLKWTNSPTLLTISALSVDYSTKKGVRGKKRKPSPLQFCSDKRL